MDDGVLQKKLTHRLANGAGLSGWIVQSRKTLLIRDTQKEEWPVKGIVIGRPTRSWLGVPLMYRDQVVGVMSVQSYVPNTFGEEDRRILSTIAAQAAIAIENARLHKVTRRRAEEMTALYDTSLEISDQADLSSLLWSLCNQAARLLGVTKGGIYLYDKARDELELVVSYNLGQDFTGTRLKRGEGIAGRILQTGQPFSVSDYSHWGGRARGYDGEAFTAVIGVPLQWQERVIGVVTLSRETAQQVFTSEDERLLSLFAQQAAVAIENTRLYEAEQRRAARLADILQLGTELASLQEEGALLNTLVVRSAALTERPACLVILVDETTKETVLAAQTGLPNDTPVGQRTPLTLSFFRSSLESGEPLIVPDIDRDAPELRTVLVRPDIRACSAYPMLREGRTIGVIILGSLRPHTPSAAEVTAYRLLAERAAAALENIRLYQKVLASEQEYRTLVENATELIWILDTEGNFAYFNKHAEQVSGYEAQDWVGKSFTPLIPPADLPRIEQIFVETLEGKTQSYRVPVRRDDGSLFHLAVNTAPLYREGKLVGTISFGRDVTREVQLEEQFRQAQKMEAVGQLAGGIAHDFNNLLTIIRLSTQLLARQLHPKDPLWEHVQPIHETVERATDLTRQLLSFSRREIIEPRVLNLNEVVSGLSPMLQRILREDVKLETALAADPWPVYVDPTQMDQVIVNLVVNARDAMPRGGTLTIETTNVVLDDAYAARYVAVPAGEYVLLAISDTGVGMNDEIKAHLFEPFFTTKERGRGTGLGLSTVYGIIKQNGGHIGVHSEVEQGTTFKIYLPRAEEVETEVEAGIHSSASTSTARGTETILVAEDDAPVRRLAVHILETHGYQVLAAEDGVEALQISERYDGIIHLLLTDVVMPRMNGRELAERLQPQRPEMRVLYMSGYADNAIAHHGVLTKGMNFVPKPLTLETLTQKVRAVLNDEV